MVTLDADLLGLDLTAAVQESISENMGLEDSLPLGGALAAVKDDTPSGHGEADDEFSSFVHADPLHPSRQEPTPTVHAPHMTAAGNAEDEDEFTSFSSATPSTVPAPPITQPTVTFDVFGGGIPSTSTATDLEANGDIFSDFTSAPPPVMPSSDLTLPGGAPGSLSLFSNSDSSSAGNFTATSQLANTAIMLSRPTSYSSKAFAPTSGESSMFPSTLLPPNGAAPAPSSAGTGTISSPEPLTAQAQQLFDRIPDVRFMLSNVLLSPKSFL